MSILSPLIGLIERWQRLFCFAGKIGPGPPRHHGPIGPRAQGAQGGPATQKRPKMAPQRPGTGRSHYLGYVSDGSGPRSAGSGHRWEDPAKMDQKRVVGDCLTSPESHKALWSPQSLSVWLSQRGNCAGGWAVESLGPHGPRAPWDPCPPQGPPWAPRAPQGPQKRRRGLPDLPRGLPEPPRAMPKPSRWLLKLLRRTPEPAQDPLRISSKPPKLSPRMNRE